MTVGLWRLSSLDGHQLPWYRPQVSVRLSGPMSAYRDWVRRQVGSATSVLVWQRVNLSKQILPLPVAWTWSKQGTTIARFCPVSWRGQILASPGQPELILASLVKLKQIWASFVHLEQIRVSPVQSTKRTGCHDGVTMKTCACQTVNTMVWTSAGRGLDLGERSYFNGVAKDMNNNPYNWEPSTWNSYWCTQSGESNWQPSTKTECDYIYGWIKKRPHTQKSHQKWWTPEI